MFGNSRPGQEAQHPRRLGADPGLGSLRNTLLRDRLVDHDRGVRLLGAHHARCHLRGELGRPVGVVEAHPPVFGRALTVSGVPSARSASSASVRLRGRVVHGPLCRCGRCSPAELALAGAPRTQAEAAAGRAHACRSATWVCTSASSQPAAPRAASPTRRSRSRRPSGAWTRTSAARGPSRAASRRRAAARDSVWRGRLDRRRALLVGADRVRTSRRPRGRAASTGTAARRSAESGAAEQLHRIAPLVLAQVELDGLRRAGDVVDAEDEIVLEPPYRPRDTRGLDGTIGSYVPNPNTG